MPWGESQHQLVLVVVHNVELALPPSPLQANSGIDERI
jgi:hypothetical protein